MTFNTRTVLRLLAVAAALVIIGGCGGVTSKVFPTADEQFRNARTEYDKKHYLKAIDGFQKVIYNFSGAPMVDSAQYFLAMCHYGMKDYFMAATEFERLVNNYPGSSFVDDGQYMTGICYFRASPKNYGLDQKDLEHAIQILQDFITDHPESDGVGEATATIKAARERLAQKKFEGGRSYFKLGYYESAAIYFQEVIDEFTDTEWAARALYYQGDIARKKGDLQAAKDKYNYFLIVYPDHELAGKARKMIAKIESRNAGAGEHK